MPDRAACPDRADAHRTQLQGARWSRTRTQGIGRADVARKPLSTRPNFYEPRARPCDLARRDRSPWEAKRPAPRPEPFDARASPNRAGAARRHSSAKNPGSERQRDATGQLFELGQVGRGKWNRRRAAGKLSEEPLQVGIHRLLRRIERPLWIHIQDHPAEAIEEHLRPGMGRRAGQEQRGAALAR